MQRIFPGFCAHRCKQEVRHHGRGVICPFGEKLRGIRNKFTKPYLYMLDEKSFLFSIVTPTPLVSLTTIRRWNSSQNMTLTKKSKDYILLFNFKFMNAF